MTNPSTLKEAAEKNSDHLTLNGKAVSKEELNKQIDEAENLSGVLIQHDGNGQFRRKISG